MKRANGLGQSRKSKDNIGFSVEMTLEMTLERTLEDVVTCLYQSNNSKSKLYEELIGMTDRALLRIALRRSNKIKTQAADFLGINRNTLQKKLVKLGME